MNKENIERGRLSRARGKRFETLVKKDLEKRNWIVDKWTNNVKFVKETIPIQKNSPHDKEILIGKLIPTKPKWNNFTKSLMMNSGGFPDFIAFKRIVPKEGQRKIKIIDINKRIFDINKTYFIYGVESKMEKYLSKEEKEKCQWLLDNKIFGKILIAYKTREGRNIKVNYEEFK